MNKKLSIFMVVVMLSQLFTTACVSASQSFSDVTEEHWAYEYVVRAKKEEMINGYEDGTFRPEAALSRAEWAKMVCELAGIEPKDTYSYYDDTDGHWANGYINTVQSKGGMAGWGDGTYKPDDPISRSDAVVSLVYTLGYGLKTNEYMYNTPMFNDGLNLSAEFAASNGIIGGYSDGTFRPENALTRAEGAKILCSALDYKNQVDAATPEPDYSLTDNFTKEDLLSLIENHAHIDYIREIGYDVKETEEAYWWSQGGRSYYIDKTNIQVLSGVFDNQMNYIDEIYGVAAPASVILPERIGKDSSIVVDGGFVYIPYGKLAVFGPQRSEEYAGEVVKKDTMVAVTSVEVLNGNTGWYDWPLRSLIEKEIYFDAKRDYGKYMTYEGNAIIELKSENDDYYLVGMETRIFYYDMNYESRFDSMLVYRVNKHTYQVEFVQTLPMGFGSGVWTKLNPEIVDEFNVDIYNGY